VANQNQVVVAAKGLNTFPNYFNLSPGALLEALNVVIDRDNVIQPRRGFFEYGNSFGGVNDRVKQIISYKNRILRHVLTALQYDDGTGVFSPFTNDTVTEVETGLRIKSIEENGNLYFTTSQGIKKISASSAEGLATAEIQYAGGVKALNLEANVDYSTPGFLLSNYKVAYRLVWGITDANDNLILGSPSNRVVVENVSSTSAVVELNFPVPSSVTSTSYFYQIYRTAIFDQSGGEIDPGDEMYLVYEDFVTSAEISAGEIGPIVDITPEDIRAGGALLYTNPTSGEGIEQANERPPFATDIDNYKGYTFYANTSTVQRLNFSVLAVDDFISGTSSVTITDGTDSNTYTFRGTNASGQLQLTGAATDFYNGATATAKYFTLNSSLDDREYLFWFKKDATKDIEPSVAGKINIELDITASTTLAEIADVIAQALVDTGDFNVSEATPTDLDISWANNGAVAASGGYTDTVGTSLTFATFVNGTGENAASNFVFLPRVPSTGEVGPTPAQQIEQLALSLVNVINSEDTLVNAYYLSGYNDVPGQILLENRDVTGEAFWIYANSTSTGGEFNPTLPATNTASVISSNEVKPNRIYYSKFQQPEAVPLVNYLDVGPRDRAITRIVALTDSLFVFKEDEIYRLSGDTAPFQVTSFDKSVYLTAADSAAVLNNQIYGLTTQGVIAVTEGGVQVISRPIENQVLGVQKFGDSYKTISFGVSYESDRAYHLWTLTQSTDTVATQCFRFNTFTNSWTRWDLQATCGLVNFTDDKLYLGAGDDNALLKERKTLTRLDHADRQYDLNVLLNGVDENILSLSSIDTSQEGDVVIQTQYVTISQYNRLLKQIDRDNFINQFSTPDYFSTLEMTAGSNMRAKLVALANKLDADPQVADTTYATNIATATQTVLSTSHTATTVTLTFASNVIAEDRIITLSGMNTVPVLSGDYQVTASTGTTVTIEAIINTDGSAGSVTTNVENFQDCQACFNIITEQMNDDAGLFFSNYFQSTGTSDQEGTILDADVVNNELTLNFSLPFMQGEITLYKAIDTKVIYAPQFFGDPSKTKQVSEGTMMFENSNYSSATLAYSSDLSPYFEEIPFNGQGIGDFGQFSWSNQNWGGVGAPIPLRTLIPRQKQRCRFLNVQFTHRSAFEKYSIFGLSLTFRIVSSRGYR
jgi:hypothetical protein